MTIHNIIQKQPDSYYYTNYFEAMDGDPEKTGVIDTTPDGGLLVMPTNLVAGRPVLPDHMPTKLRRGGPGIKVQPLLDVNRWRGAALLVPQVFKDILEELEPGVHQFFPMDYFEKEERIGGGYLFVICKRLDTLHDTACRPERNERGFLPRTANPEDRKIVFAAGKIAGHHAWVDKFIGGQLVSEEFGQRLQAENLTGLTFEPMIVEP